jgi:hypothetical protein
VTHAKCNKKIMEFKGVILSFWLGEQWRPLWKITLSAMIKKDETCKYCWKNILGKENIL